MCVSADDANEYLFLGGNNGKLYCVDTAGMCVLTETDLSPQGSTENANIIAISSARIKGSIHFVVCLSDTGNNN